MRQIILAIFFLCCPGRSDAAPQQAKVLEHILKGKPCQMAGYTRYKNECYSPEKLKLVKKP